MRLKVSPMMGWLAGSTISLVPSLLSARHGISPVWAVLYRHHLPAEFQFTEGNRAKQQTSGRRKTRYPARQAALLGIIGCRCEPASTGAQRQVPGMGLLVVRGRKGQGESRPEKHIGQGRAGSRPSKPYGPGAGRSAGKSASKTRGVKGASVC